MAALDLGRAFFERVLYVGYHFAGPGAALETFYNARFFHDWYVSIQDGTTHYDRYIRRVALLEQFAEFRDEHPFTPGQGADTYEVYVLLDGGIDYLLPALPQTGVDDLHAGVPESPCQDDYSPVVGVYGRFGQQNANRITLFHENFPLFDQKVAGLV